ncbi:MAG: hypothetical protein ACLQA5_23545 [Solirubrobacteraceae bacterium]
MATEAEPATPQNSDVTRRTWLAGDKRSAATGKLQPLSSPAVMYLTAAAVVVSLGSIVLVAIRL